MHKEKQLLNAYASNSCSWVLREPTGFSWCRTSALNRRALHARRAPSSFAPICGAKKSDSIGDSPRLNQRQEFKGIQVRSA